MNNKFVTLDDNVTVRADAIALYQRLTQAGHALTVKDSQLFVSGTLTPAQRDTIRPLRFHLMHLAGK